MKITQLSKVTIALAAAALCSPLYANENVRVINGTTEPIPVTVLGGGGGGGAVTIADGADVAEGTSNDVIGTAGGQGTVSSKLRLMTSQLASILSGVTAATPAGTNVIGKVSIDQTTPGTTNLVALAANQSVNVAQMNGVATTMGNGIAGTGVQRVAIASDNTPYPVKIDQTTPGTTNLVAANNTQLNGVALLAGNGVTGTGSQRVTIASDNTPYPVKIDQTTPGTTNLVALAANQSVNVAQINGVAPSMGNGVSGTGVQRVTMASDSTGNFGVAQASTTSGQIGPLVQTATTTGAPTYTTGQTNPISTTTSGAMRVDIQSGAGTLLTFNGGATTAGTLRIAPATDSPGINTIASAVNARGVYDSGIATTTNPANATAGNAVGMMMDKAGRTVVTPGNVREMISSQYTALAASSETTIITGVASEFHDLTDLVVTTAGSAAATLTIKDTTSGTTRFVLNYPNAAVAPGSPLVLHFSPPISQSTAAGNWTVTNSVTTATNITCVYVVNK